MPLAPVPMLGHVTSSYDSVELGRPFALALCRRRHRTHSAPGSTPVGDRLVEVEVTSRVRRSRKEPAAMAEIPMITPLAKLVAALRGARTGRAGLRNTGRGNQCAPPTPA